MGCSDQAQPVLNLLYYEYLVDEQSAKFVQEVSRRYSIGTLERMAEFGPRPARRAATLALGFLADFGSNGVFGRRLNDPDRCVRMLADNGIRDIWCRDGSVSQQQQLQIIIRLNVAGQHEQAICAASRLQAQTPWFAEAWNQRAIAHFHQGALSPAARDCRQALELNPYHFEAAVGMAQCYLELADGYAALDAFRRALKLNPGLEGVRAQVTLLERTLEEKEG